MKKSAHFKIEELVCKDVFIRDGQSAWRYFRPVAIDFLDWFRENINKRVFINNWLSGGDKDERGLRCNLCYEVRKQTKLYTSAHVFGCAFDFNVEDMTPDQVRLWIGNNIAEFFRQYPEYPAKIRLESSKFAPTWIHIDFFEHDITGIIHLVKPIK